jgi:hypothetical protein
MDSLKLIRTQHEYVLHQVRQQRLVAQQPEPGCGWRTLASSIGVVLASASRGDAPCETLSERVDAIRVIGRDEAKESQTSEEVSRTISTTHGLRNELYLSSTLA